MRTEAHLPHLGERHRGERIKPFRAETKRWQPRHRQRVEAHLVRGDRWVAAIYNREEQEFWHRVAPGPDGWYRIAAEEVDKWTIEPHSPRPLAPDTLVLDDPRDVWKLPRDGSGPNAVLTRKGWYEALGVDPPDQREAVA